MTPNNHGHTNSTHHVETDMPTLTKKQPKPTRGIHKGIVVEDISECTSWGKSRCELIGLHRTFGDAPLETPTLERLEFLPRHGIHKGSVVEGAVERTSWGKSDVIGRVASQTPEDFTAHLEMHPLKNLLWSIQRYCQHMGYLKEVL
jgi:hypothetical protein